MVSAQRREHLQSLLPVHENAAAVLRMICELCVSEVAVTGARVRVLGSTSADHGGGIAHTTDSLGVTLEDLATTAGAGPSVDAFELGRPVLVPDLNSDGVRWPGFSAEAVTAGIAAVFAFPLQLGGVRLGVLEMHRGVAGSLTPAQLVDALLLADAATDTIFHDLHGSASLELSGLVDIQAEVHQATGMVAVELTVTLQDALLRIRGYAFAQQRTLAEVARDIVERRLWLDSGK